MRTVRFYVVPATESAFNGDSPRML